MFNTLKKRLLVSAVLIMTLAGLLGFDYFTGQQAGFYLILAVISSMCFYEFAKLYGNINMNLPWDFPIAIGLSGLVIIWVLVTFPRIELSKSAADIKLITWDTPMLLSFTVFMIIAVLYYLRRIKDFYQIIILFFGFAYVYIPVWSLAQLRTKGIVLVVYLVAMVKIADSIAYFWGTRFGRHKLAEKISPNKTVEGFIAGLLGAAVLGMAAFCLLPARMFGLGDSLIPFWLILMINLILVFVAQLGDLFESYIKRICNVKDSGHLLGPLGGILDLTDSLLLAAPVAAFLFLKLN